MAIQISQTYARIGIDRTPARLDIETERARLELTQKQAKVNIHTELPKVEIDQYQCFATAGLKNSLDLTKESADRGYQQALDYIGKTASDGNRLAAIEQGGNPIADIAVRDAYPEHEFGLDFIPKAAPKIEIKGSVQFDPQRNSEGVNNGVDGNFTPGSTRIDFTPEKVSVFLQQYASIKVNYVGNNTDYYV